MSNKSSGSPGAEALGTVKRVLRRKVSDADRAELDRSLHSLFDARSAVERQHKRAAKAVAKLRARLAAIEVQLAQLHGQWKRPEIEAPVDCRVERTSTEVLLVRLDTGLVHARRPLTREEHAAMASTLPHMPDRPRVLHVEFDPDDRVTKHMEKERERKVERDLLSVPLTLEAVFNEVDSEEEGDDDEPQAKASKAKRPRKGKREVNQPDLPMTPKEG